MRPASWTASWKVRAVAVPLREVHCRVVAETVEGLVPQRHSWETWHAKPLLQCCADEVRVPDGEAGSPYGPGPGVLDPMQFEGGGQVRLSAGLRHVGVLGAWGGR